MSVGRIIDVSLPVLEKECIELGILRSILSGELLLPCVNIQAYGYCLSGFAVAETRCLINSYGTAFNVNRQAM